MSKDAAVNLSTFFTETFRMCCTNEVIEKMNLPLSSKDISQSMII